MPKITKTLDTIDYNQEDITLLIKENLRQNHQRELSEVPDFYNRVDKGDRGPHCSMQTPRPDTLELPVTVTSHATSC